MVLVEGSDRVLPPYPPDLSEKARLQLERLGVTVWLGRRVTGIDARGVQLGNERLEAKTVIWAAGVATSPLGATLGAPLDRAGRVLVEPDLSVPGHPEVHVVGDLAALDRPCPASRRPPSRWGATPPATSSAPWRKNRTSPFATATTASSPPSAATPRWRCSAG